MESAGNSENNDTLQLGGSIELSGFGVLDKPVMIVVKKIIGNHARHFSERCQKFEKLGFVLKLVHEREKSEKYELHAKLIDNGKVYASEVIDRNLFVAVDNAVKKLMAESSL